MWSRPKLSTDAFALSVRLAAVFVLLWKLWLPDCFYRWKILLISIQAPHAPLSHPAVFQSVHSSSRCWRYFIHTGFYPAKLSDSCLIPGRCRPPDSRLKTVETIQFQCSWDWVVFKESIFEAASIHSFMHLCKFWGFLFLSVDVSGYKPLARAVFTAPVHFLFSLQHTHINKHTHQVNRLASRALRVCVCVCLSA